MRAHHIRMRETGSLSRAARSPLDREPRRDRDRWIDARFAPVLLRKLAAKLPRDLPASLFVVVHVTPDHPSLLPELMNKRGPLRASHPLHGERTVPGHIYIAPPDNHLLVREGSVEVVRGPKENGHRPAADPLFRTASAAYAGPRAVVGGRAVVGKSGLRDQRG